MRFVRWFVAAFSAVSVAPAVAHGALTLVGGEFQVNTYTTGYQSLDMDGPSVCCDAQGNFVVAWTSRGQDGDNDGVFAQRYDRSGGPVGSEFQVNTYTPGQQNQASICCSAAGDFIVVWASFDQDGDGFGVFGQRYDSGGAAIGTEFQVNTYTTDHQGYPAIACDPAGNAIMTWASMQDGDRSGVFAQRYDSAGSAQGGEFQVNTYTPGYQTHPAVARAADGDFVVAWDSYPDQDGDAAGVFAQRFSSSGTAQGTEFQVNSYTVDYQRTAAVGSDPAGNFVILWESEGQDGEMLGVFGQRYAASGAPRGTEFQVNTYTESDQDDVAVTVAANGAFAAVWESKHDGDNDGVFAQRYDAGGAPVGTEFQLNTYTTNQQENPAVCGDPNGSFVVVWSGAGNEDGDQRGVFGQRVSAGLGASPAPVLSGLALVLLAAALSLFGAAVLRLRQRRES